MPAVLLEHAQMGDESATCAISATVDDVSVGVDVVLACTCNILAMILLSDMASPDTNDRRRFVSTALNKIPGT